MIVRSTRSPSVPSDSSRTASRIRSVAPARRRPSASASSSASSVFDARPRCRWRRARTRPSPAPRFEAARESAAQSCASPSRTREKIDVTDTASVELAALAAQHQPAHGVGGGLRGPPGPRPFRPQSAVRRHAVFASASAAAVVITPSATIRVLARIVGERPARPSSTPTWRFRLRLPVHVSTRSPRPLSPASVSRRPPIAHDSREISASPRVMSAASALCPSPADSTTPAAIAMMFLSAAPISTPTTSSDPYSRKYELRNSSCTAARPRRRVDAATSAVGCRARPRRRSSARTARRPDAGRASPRRRPPTCVAGCRSRAPSSRSPEWRPAGSRGRRVQHRAETVRWHGQNHVPRAGERFLERYAWLQRCRERRCRADRSDSPSARSSPERSPHRGPTTGPRDLKAEMDRKRRAPASSAKDRRPAQNDRTSSTIVEVTLVQATGRPRSRVSPCPAPRQSRTAARSPGRRKQDVRTVVMTWPRQ